MRSLKLKVVSFLVGIMFCLNAFAVIWTSQVGSYNQYKVTTVKTTTVNGVTTTSSVVTNAYLLTTSVDVTKVGWVKQPGTYTQFKSDGGSTKYVKDIVITTPTPPPPTSDDICKGQFICRPNWGWVVRITPPQAVTCIEVKISKDEALVYEAMQAPEYKCPVQ